MFGNSYKAFITKCEYAVSYTHLLLITILVLTGYSPLKAMVLVFLTEIVSEYLSLIHI